MHWQQQQAALRETRIKFGLSQFGQKEIGESPLDLSSAVRNVSSIDSTTSMNPWQQQLLMLKDKALERDANTLRLMTSPVMPPPANPSSLALLRSFAALSEKMPQVGFEPGQSLSDGHRALSALQQISQFTTHFGQNGNGLQNATSGVPANHFLQRAPMSLQNWSSIMVHPACPPSNIRMTSSKLDLARDIFKCVMCHERFTSLEGLTRHLKESDHSAISATADRHRHHTETSTPENSPSTFSRSSSPPASPKPLPSKNTAPVASSSSSVPRKLVRGQDVWLGKGQEQTRQILKCMWCGQSFPSLADLTVHMQETKHYTKVISQEQIAAWNCGSPSPPSILIPGQVSEGKAQVAAAHQAQKRDLGKSNLGSVFTCKVCNASFPSLRDLSIHISLKSHQVDTSGLAEAPLTDSKCKSMKRGHLNNNSNNKKKALPVRKLLELERASQHPSDDVTALKDGERLSDDVIRFGQIEEVDEEVENFVSSKKSTSILGSLEKMVESSFQDMRCNGRKRNQGTGNGILQRLGIDDDQHHSVMMVTKKTPHMFDFYRQCQSSSWKEKDEIKRHLKMADDSKTDKDDLDSETSESHSNGPASNPLFALKELCNNTCSPRRGPIKSVSPSLSTSSVSSSPPRPHSDQNGNINEQIKADENIVKCSIDSFQSISSSEENENAEKKLALCTAGISPELIRVKKDSELLRSARTSRRMTKNKMSQNDEAKTPSGTVATADNAESQSSTEAKFFRYSELAKVLAAGN